MAGGIPVDVFDGLVEILHHAARDFIVKKFFCILALGNRQDGSSQNIPRAFTAVPLHRLFVQTLFGHRQEPLGHIPMHQQALCGIADRWPAGFGVVHDLTGHGKIGARIDVDVAVTRAGFDHRNGRLLHNSADQTRSAARDQHI